MTYLLVHKVIFEATVDSPKKEVSAVCDKLFDEHVCSAFEKTFQKFENDDITIEQPIVLDLGTITEEELEYSIADKLYQILLRYRCDNAVPSAPKLLVKSELEMFLNYIQKPVIPWLVGQSDDFQLHKIAETAMEQLLQSENLINQLLYIITQDELCFRRFFNISSQQPKFRKVLKKMIQNLPQTFNMYSQLIDILVDIKPSDTLFFNETVYSLFYPIYFLPCEEREVFLEALCILLYQKKLIGIEKFHQWLLGPMKQFTVLKAVVQMQEQLPELEYTMESLKQSTTILDREFAPFKQYISTFAKQSDFSPKDLYTLTEKVIKWRKILKQYDQKITKQKIKTHEKMAPKQQQDYGNSDISVQHSLDAISDVEKSEQQQGELLSQGKTTERTNFGFTKSLEVNGEQSFEQQEAVPHWLRPETVRRQPVLKEHLHLENAGLVLLHPFFVPFFMQLGFLDEKRQFSSIEKQIRAVHLLQCLTGNPGAQEEHFLLLNKLLCGVNILFPTNMQFKATEHELEECDKLLKSAIRHWTIIKNTSIAGFQESFVKRRGVLECSQNDWILRVETKGIDILLEDIPWSIQLILFPWNDYLIHVDWKL